MNIHWEKAKEEYNLDNGEIIDIGLYYIFRWFKWNQEQVINWSSFDEIKAQKYLRENASKE